MIDDDASERLKICSHQKHACNWFQLILNI